MPLPGQKIICPACGRESVAKTVRVMDGWQVAEERLVCALCGGTVPVGDSASEQARSAAASLAAAELLGESVPPVVPTLLAEDETHFCRDCCHFLMHPFLTRCLLHRRPTEPMDDCADFAARPTDDRDGDSHACPA